MTTITTVGAALIAAATSGDPLVIDEIAVGDGDGAAIEPDAAMTELVNERARVSVLDKQVTDNIVRFRALFTPGATAYTIREAGLFAGDDLVAIVSLSPSEMPTEAWATENTQTVELVVTIAVIISDTDAITISVDTSTVYATIAYVDAKVPPFATIDETRAGSTAVKIVHPVAYKTVLDEHKASRLEHPTGNEEAQGFLRLATIPETAAGILNSVGVHPAGLKSVIDALKGGVATAGNTLKKLYDLIVAIQGAIAVIQSQLAAFAGFQNMPIYPEFVDPAADPWPFATEARHTITPTLSGSNLVVPAGKQIIHRGGKIYSTSDITGPNRTFALANNKTYHLRWYAPGHTLAPANAWPSGRFMLRDLADGSYNYGGQPEQSSAFDSRYDDALVAKIQRSNLGDTTITAFMNKAVFDQYFESGGPTSTPGIVQEVYTLNLARTPTVVLSLKSYVLGGTTPGVLPFDLDVVLLNRQVCHVQAQMNTATDIQWYAKITMLGSTFGA